MVVDAPGPYLTASLLLTGCVHLRLPDNVTLLAGDRVRRLLHSTCRGAAATHQVPCPSPTQPCMPSRDSRSAQIEEQLCIDWCSHSPQSHPSSRPHPLQRHDYGAAQSDWYLLRFHNCSGCSLSGGGQVDGQAQLWVLPPPPQERQPAGWAGSGRKAVRNWDDPSCAKPEECRRAVWG